MPDSSESQIEHALALVNQRVKNVPFHVIIKAICDGCEVLQLDPQDAGHSELVKKIRLAASLAISAVDKNPISRPRPNEVGNDMEAYLQNALQEVGLDAAAPITKSGKGKSTGYPDLGLKYEGTAVHIEVKTYASQNVDTTQRSFYLSPSDDPKVHEDGFHLIVGFEIEDRGINGISDSRERQLRDYVATDFKIVDLYNLPCDLKLEFNSDNRRMYGGR